VFLDPDYPSVNPYKKNVFVKKVILCVKKSIRKKFKKTDTRFEFLDPDYPSVNPYKKNFSKKSNPLCNKIDSKKILKN
jgi:hypothetical protein